MRLIFIAFLFGYGTGLWSQEITTEDITQLFEPLTESSGLIELDGVFITHNDSGDGPYLYEVDTATGWVSREVFIQGAQQIDWEDLCYDEDHIYIGDFGNNQGNRTNLGIYKILRSEYFQNVNDTVPSEFIAFSYADQSDFSSSEFSSNFDAEAIISMEDSLYVFTKNWGDLKSNVYPIPKDAGEYLVQKLDSLDIGGLITGADYIEETDQVILCGYNLINAFVVKLENIDENHFSEGSLIKSNISVTGSVQVEGISIESDSTFFLTSESSIFGNPRMTRVICQNTVGVIDFSDQFAHVYPNPVDNDLVIKGLKIINLGLFDQEGKFIQEIKEPRTSLEHLKPGIYILYYLGNGWGQNKSWKIIKN